MPRRSPARAWTLATIPIIAGAGFALAALVACGEGDAMPDAPPPVPVRADTPSAPAPTAPIAPVEDRALRVTVVDGLGLPVRGAEVTAWPAGAEPARARTDLHGRCRVPADDAVYLTVDHPDFAPVLAAHDGGSARTFDLRSGDGLPVIVRDADGKPRADARVTAVPTPWRADWPPVRLGWVRTAQTDRLGGATLYRMPPCSWRLTAQLEGHEPVSRTVFSQGRRVAPVELVLGATRTYGGSVRWHEGGPAVGARVQPLPAVDPDPTATVGPAVVTDGEGRFSGLGAAPALSIRVEGKGTWRGPGPDAEPSTTEWRLPAGPVVSGVVLADGKPVVAARVRASTPDGAPLPWDSGTWEPEVLTGTDGSFRLACTSEGRIAIHASSPGGLRATALADVPSAGPITLQCTSVAFSGSVRSSAGPVPQAMIALLDDDLTLRAQTASDDLGRFELRTEGAGTVLRISAAGFATRWLPWTPDRGSAAVVLEKGHRLEGLALRADGTPAVGAEVIVVGPEPSTVPPRTATTGADGRFSIDSLPAGQAHVFYSFLSAVPAERAAAAVATQTFVALPQTEELVLRPR